MIESWWPIWIPLISSGAKPRCCNVGSNLVVFWSCSFVLICPNSELFLEQSWHGVTVACLYKVELSLIKYLTQGKGDCQSRSKVELGCAFWILGTFGSCCLRDSVADFIFHGRDFALWFELTACVIEMPAYKLTYFNVRARAELARLMFQYAGQDFQEVRFEQKEWFDYKPSELNNLLTLQ